MGPHFVYGIYRNKHCRSGVNTEAPVSTTDAWMVLRE